jgi:integrase
MPRKPRVTTPGNIEQRAGVYRLRLHVAGQMHRFTFEPGTSIESVRRFAVEKHRELQLAATKRARRTGRRRVSATRMSDLLDVYIKEHVPLLAESTQDSYREICGFIRQFFVERAGDPRVEEVSRKHVEAFLAWRRMTRIDPASQRRREAASLIPRLAERDEGEQLTAPQLAAALGVAESWIDSRATRAPVAGPLPWHPLGKRGGRVFIVREVRAWLLAEQSRERPGRSATLSNRTVQRDRAILHRIFKIAERLELCESNPVGRTEAPKADPHTPVILDLDAYERLLAAAEGRPMLTLYLLLLGESGVRSKSEALWLRWEDVDLEGGFLFVASSREHRTKGGKGRWVPLTQRLLAALRAHAALFRLATYDGERSPWLFHHEFTRRTHRAGTRIASLDVSARAAIQRAGLPKGFRIHDLRHRRVTSWLAEGQNIVHVKEAVGHADLKTTMSYTHLAREHLRALVRPREAVEPTGVPVRRSGRASAGGTGEGGQHRR